MTPQCANLVEAESPVTSLRFRSLPRCEQAVNVCCTFCVWERLWFSG